MHGIRGVLAGLIWPAGSSLPLQSSLGAHVPASQAARGPATIGAFITDAITVVRRLGGYRVGLPSQPGCNVLVILAPCRMRVPTSARQFRYRCMPYGAAHSLSAVSTSCKDCGVCYHDARLAANWTRHTISRGTESPVPRSRRTGARTLWRPMATVDAAVDPS